MDTTTTHDLSTIARNRYREALPAASRRVMCGLQDCGVRPVDALAYAQAGFNTAAAMRKLKAQRLTAESAAAYVNVGVKAAAQMAVLKEGGVTPDLVPAYRAEGVKSYTRMVSLTEVELDPNTLGRLRGAGVVPLAHCEDFARSQGLRERPVLSGLGLDDEPSDALTSVMARSAAGARLPHAGYDEISRRGGETEIKGRYGTQRISPVDINSKGTLMLLHREGWRKYGRRAHRASLSYLVGRENGSPFAVRVPGNITTIAAALEWMEPAEVTKARLAHRKVIRQGAAYVVETGSERDHMAGSGRHAWDADARVLSHPEHGEIEVPFPARLVSQRALPMGRGSTWGGGIR